MLLVVVVVGYLERGKMDGWYVVTKSFSFRVRTTFLCLALSRLFLFLVSEDLICSMLQKRKLPLRLYVALT